MKFDGAITDAEFQNALESAMFRLLSEVRTEPMRTETLATIFCQDRNAMAQQLKSMEGAEKVARGKWRVPVWRMPAGYLARIGWVR